MKESSNKIRLLLISPPVVHLQSYLNLISEGIDEIYVVSAERPKTALKIKWSKANLTFRKPWYFFRTVNTLRKVFREFQPHIIHAHQLGSLTAYVIYSLGKFKTPIVATAWGSDVLVLPNQNFLLRKLITYTLKRADAFTVDAEFMAVRMRALVPKRSLKILLANFGVITAVEKVEKSKLIYSNRVHQPLYRIDAIIRAFASFSRTQEGKDWKLAIGGSGSETQLLKKLSSELSITDKVRFLGWLEPKENQAMYAQAKVYVSIPQSDGTSISLLEAMANGCFPIVSDLPANAEWIIDGVNGQVVKDVSSDYLSDLSQLPFEKVALHNQDLIARKGSFGVNRDAFLDLYRGLISANEKKDQ